MEFKKTDNGSAFIEVDCQHKDFDGKFTFDGKIGLIRVLYKKGIPLRFEKLKICDTEITDPINTGTLDYQYTTIGLIDIPMDIEFKEGGDLIFNQFNKPNYITEDGTQVNWDSYRNSVEKIQLFLKQKNKQETQCENCKHFNKVTGSYYFGRCQKILTMVCIINNDQDTYGTYLFVRNEFCCNQYQEKK